MVIRHNIRYKKADTKEYTLTYHHRLVWPVFELYKKSTSTA